MSASRGPSNVLQPLQMVPDENVKNRNQNLLKLNLVTSARADSTGAENRHGNSFDNDDLEPHDLPGDRSNVSSKPAARKSGKGGRAPKAPLTSGPKKGPKVTGEKPRKRNLGGNLAQPPQMPLVKHHHSVKKPQTPSVSRRNARERNRVKQVNGGFAVLKNHVPHLKSKTSKVDTLRAAVDYIKLLRELLGAPIDESQLFQGPVLITEVEDHPANNSKSRRDDSSCNSSIASDLMVSSTTPTPPIVRMVQQPHHPQPVSHRPPTSSPSPMDISLGAAEASSAFFADLASGGDSPASRQEGPFFALEPQDQDQGQQQQEAGTEQIQLQVDYDINSIVYQLPSDNPAFRLEDLVLLENGAPASPCLSTTGSSTSSSSSASSSSSSSNHPEVDSSGFCSAFDLLGHSRDDNDPIITSTHSQIEAMILQPQQPVRQVLPGGPAASGQTNLQLQQQPTQQILYNLPNISTLRKSSWANPAWSSCD